MKHMGKTAYTFDRLKFWLPQNLPFKPKLLMQLNLWNVLMQMCIRKRTVSLLSLSQTKHPWCKKVWPNEVKSYL